MSIWGALPAAPDRPRATPGGAGPRVDAAHSALVSLRDEQRRLERLGFETPLARCHQQLRFWSFVSAVCSLEPGKVA